MKPIVIDTIVYGATEKCVIFIDKKEFQGWQIAKPLNYEHISLYNKIIMCIKILRGKAIAVQYFSDLSKKEQINYVKDKLEKQRIEYFKNVD